MTERAFKKQAQQRQLGRLRYSLHFGALFFAIYTMLALLGSDAVPLTASFSIASAGLLVGGIMGFFRWNHMEVQYSWFLKSQACSAPRFVA